MDYSHCVSDRIQFLWAPARAPCVWCPHPGHLDTVPSHLILCGPQIQTPDTAASFDGIPRLGWLGSHAAVAEKCSIE